MTTSNTINRIKLREDKKVVVKERRKKKN